MQKLINAMKSGEKCCTFCRKVKPLNDYHASINTADGRQARCRVCKLNDNRAWREANKGKVSQCKRNYAVRNWAAIRKRQKEYMSTRKVEAAEYRRRWNLSKRYGITVDRFTEMLDSQGGACAVCGKTQGRQVVDHDHVTGKVRGILCVRCNVSIGGLGDNAEGLMRAICYLEKANELDARRAV
jgi:hypothetical protein